MDHIRFTQPSGSYRYWQYDPLTYPTCQAADAAFDLLSDSQKLALTTPVQPSSDTGWEQKNCGGADPVSIDDPSIDQDFSGEQSVEYFEPAQS